MKCFKGFLENIYNCLPEIHCIARAVSDLDVSSSLAFVAMERNYTRPVFGKDLSLKDSRHPVIEQNRSFTPNTVEMKNGDCLLLTGPNMAGKKHFNEANSFKCFVGSDRVLCGLFSYEASCF